MRTLVVGLGSIAAAIVVAALAPRDTTAPAEPRPAHVGSPPLPAVAPAPAPVAATTAPAPPSDAAREPSPETTWLLPDGKRVPALNGAISPAPLRSAWPPHVPWSPIVGT